MEEPSLSDEERRALRGSKFAPLSAPRPPSTRSQPRLAHPGGLITTNKAAALAKFLERKLQKPGGLETINPSLLELAVKNAKETVIASNSGSSSSGRAVRHVISFHDSSGSTCEVQVGTEMHQPNEGKKKGKKNKKRKMLKNAEDDVSGKRRLKKKKRKMSKNYKSTLKKVKS